MEEEEEEAVEVEGGSATRNVRVSASRAIVSIIEVASGAAP